MEYNNDKLDDFDDIENYFLLKKNNTIDTINNTINNTIEETNYIDYLELTDAQIDKLILGIDLNTTKQNTNICNHCKSSNLITDNLKCYVVCEDCASIVRESVEEYLEYSNNENDTNSRYGQPSSFFFPKTSLGSKIVSSKYNKLCLIQKQGQMPYKEKNLMCSLEKIQNKCKKYNITQTNICSIIRNDTWKDESYKVPTVHTRSQLSESQRIEVLQKLESGEAVKSILKDYQISQTQLYRMKTKN
jgi:Mor family transcriptional regulator